MVLDSFFRILFISFKKIIVIHLQLYAFSPQFLHTTPAKTTSLPHFHPPLDFVHVSFIVVPVTPSPHCPLPTPPRLLLDFS